MISIISLGNFQPLSESLKPHLTGEKEGTSENTRRAEEKATTPARFLRSLSLVSTRFFSCGIGREEKNLKQSNLPFVVFPVSLL